jgi:hypothetical protein
MASMTITIIISTSENPSRSADDWDFFRHINLVRMGMSVGNK